MAHPDLLHIKLSALGISRRNMRPGRKAPDVSEDVSDILPAIREKGSRQTLVARRGGKSYGVLHSRAMPPPPRRSQSLPERQCLGPDCEAFCAACAWRRCGRSVFAAASGEGAERAG